MGMLNKLVVLPVFLLIACTVSASNSKHRSMYSGQEGRSIKSLSSEDIAELKAGSGWGLAKTAELNGVPGPIHLLEMKDEINLSSEQTLEIEKLFNEMNAAAVKLGNQLIEKELNLEMRFQENVPGEKELKSLLREIGDIRSELRFVHLSAHLKTPAILSDQQIDKYNALRGYFSSDPCMNIPEGHNREMWLKHNNCN
ncbi:MAG: hypothetical protein KTR35_17805 [Gammaproteobacteria bacterium]|nr:hypothetical protein [Gammaproteobacteria bacterium]